MSTEVKSPAAMEFAGHGLGGANLEHARDHNQRVTLQAIRLNGPLSRADLAEITGLTLPSIANITRRLSALDLIVEDSVKSGARGQPAKQIAIKPDGCAALGINIDRDHVSLAIIDLAGEVRASVIEDVNYAAPDDVVAIVQRHLPELLGHASLARKKLIGAGVAMPDEFGRLELPHTRDSPFKAWATTDIRTLLADRIRLPIYVENDATSAALGEMQFGARPGVTDFFYVFIGIGLGGGLVLDGKPCRGATGRSGELGFMAIAGGNPREKYLADVVSLNVLYRRLAKAGHAAATPAALMALNDEARGIVEAWLDAAALHLSQAFATIACLVNPGTIYLGGRLPQAMLEALCRRIETRGREAREHFSDMPKIALATRAEDAAVLGAAVLPIAAMLLPGDAALRTAGRG